MKKFSLLFIFAVVFFSLSNAQQDINAAKVNELRTGQTSFPASRSILVSSLNESFENTWPPDGWTIYSPDGGSGWTYVNVGTAIPGWNGGSVVMTPDGSGGQKQAFCTWTTGGAASNDQWLVTPQISIASNYTMSFWIRKYGNYKDNLRVLLSSSTNSMSDFTTEIANIEYQVTDSGWYSRQYSMGVYNGQNIYIAFNETVDNTYVDGAAIFIDLVKIDQGTAIDSPSEKVEISLSPNPAHDNLTILSELPIKKIQLTDLTGRVYSENNYNNQRVQLSVSDLNPGIYLIRVETKNGFSTRKFCVSK